MIKLKKLNEESNKKVNYKGEDFIVKSIDVDDDEIENTTLDLENDNNSKSITLKAFIVGNATTNDSYINSLVNQISKPEEQEVNKRVERPKKSEKEQAIEDARADFFAKPKNSKYFRQLEKELYTSALSEYQLVYYDEFKRLNSSAIDKKKRTTSETISSTYPGDVDELIAWLKDAIVSIDVEASDSNYQSTKDIVDEFNKRDGTHYEPRLRDKIGNAYIARLTSDKDVLSKMPEEVKEWKAKKNIGKLNQYIMGDVYYEPDNALTSNSLVFDLLDTYKFKLGKQKPEKENKEDGEK